MTDQAAITAEIIEDAKITLSADGLTADEIEAAMPAITEAANFYAGTLVSANDAQMANVRSGYAGKNGIFERMYQSPSLPAPIARRLHEACE